MGNAPHFSECKGPHSEIMTKIRKIMGTAKAEQDQGPRTPYRGADAEVTTEGRGTMEVKSE